MKNFEMIAYGVAHLLDAICIVGSLGFCHTTFTQKTSLAIAKRRMKNERKRKSPR